MRRAISKKKEKVIIAERQTFVYGDAARGIPGAIANGVSETAAEAIYKEILDFRELRLQQGARRVLRQGHL